MKPSFLLSMIATALALPFEQQALHQDAELRLIELAPGVQNLVTMEQILEIKRNGINFMDVTDHVSPSVLSHEIRQNASFPNEPLQRKLVNKLIPELSKSELQLQLTKFSSFYTRYAKSDTGLESSNWLFNKLLDYVGDREDISVRQFNHSWQQKSVIVSIKGTENPDKVVIVGAHQDSINLLMPGVLPAPGADDDGSGSVTILEVLRVLLSQGFKPKNTLEFHWYSAEELGLLGSQDVFEDYAARDVNVRAMLQQDMTGYSAGSKEKNDGKDELGVITDYVDPGLTNYIKLLITEYCSIPYVETSCGYACSDHGSASKYGYQSAFVIESAFENSDHKIHTTEDKVEYLDFDHMLEHAKLTLSYAIELSKYEDL